MTGPPPEVLVLYLAIVADAAQRLGNLEYDEAADTAARLYQRSRDIRSTVATYRAAADDLELAVRVGLVADATERKGRI